MREKIFLKKSSRPSKSTPSSFFQFRNLFKFGIILLFWIAFIPLLWHQKTKNAEDKTAPAKVMKEMPKSPVPASSVEGEAQPREAVPPAPPLTDKVAVPQPSEKAEPLKATGTMSGQAREPQGARREDEAKPPIGPVPEVRPMPPATGVPAASQEAAAEAPAARPTALSKELAPDKTKPGGSAMSTEKSKPAGGAIPGEKAKPGTGLASVEKAKPGAATATLAGSGAGAGTAVSPTASKPSTPKGQQPQAAISPAKPSAQPPPTTATAANRTKTPTNIASKPPTPASPSATPQATPASPSAPAADKAKQLSGGINWVYIVRLGPFQNPTQAQELQKKLQQKGYAVAVKSGQSLQKGKVYHVDLKGVSDAAAAKAQLDKLQKEEQVTPVLLKVAETR
jgi:hypothetical protein